MERILEKTLEKDRTLRYQSAADLRTDLARLKREHDPAARQCGDFRECCGGFPTRVARTLVVDVCCGCSSWRVGQIIDWRSDRGAACSRDGGGILFLRGRADSHKLNSIAVLPFVNATSDPNNEYLSDGLTESLIGTLSQLPNIKVMARSTVFRFKGDQQDPQTIGKSLDVGAVLMGRVTQHGDEVGVQADLVNTADGSELWGAHYNRKLADITQVQSDITRDVSNKLQVHMSGASREKIGSAGTTNPDAYRLYLEGRQLWYGRTPAGLLKSIELFKQAIAADPNYRSLTPDLRMLTA